MIGAVVRTGWMHLRRDRAAWMLSFVVPIVVFSIFASIVGGQRRSTPSVTVVVVDEDKSERSKRLVDALRTETALKIIDNADAQSAEATVKKGDAPVALIVPKGFGATQIAFGPSRSSAPAFRLLRDPSDMIAEQVLSGLLQKTLFVSMPDMMMTGGIDALERYGGPLTPQQRENLQKQMGNLRRAPSRGSNDSSLLVKVAVTDVVGDSKKNPIIPFYGAGVGVMFLPFTASGPGRAPLDDVESGTP